MSADIPRRIIEEHKNILKDMEHIKGLTDQEISKDNFEKWRMDLLLLLRDFSSDLHKHFDLEEEGGFMQEVLEMAPQQSHAVSQLKTEHETMISNLRQILKLLKETEFPDDSKIKSIKKKTVNLITLLMAHEAAENELLETIYLQDDGIAG